MYVNAIMYYKVVDAVKVRKTIIIILITILIRLLSMLMTMEPVPRL